MKCLKINKKKFDQNDAWECPICDWRKEIVRTATRPSLEELKQWVALAPNLAFLPDEFFIVNKIIRDAQSWAASIQHLLRGDQMPPLSKCRFYLRKLEGAEVFLPNEYNYFRRSAHALAPLSNTPPPLVAESKVARKQKPKKLKESFLLPEIPKMIRVYDGPPEPRLLPSHHYDPRMEPRPYPEPPPQPSLLPPLPQRRPSHSYVYQPPMPHPAPHHPPTMPPKGVFAPPPVGPPHMASSNYRREEPPKPIDSPQSKCESCGQLFVAGAHNEPLACSQCHRFHHTLCVGKYGGRIYPAFVWYHLSHFFLILVRTVLR